MMKLFHENISRYSAVSYFRKENFIIDISKDSKYATRVNVVLWNLYFKNISKQ